MTKFAGVETFLRRLLGLHEERNILFFTDNVEKLYWLGGHQLPGSTKPSEGWQWVDGTKFYYKNWMNKTRIITDPILDVLSLGNPVLAIANIADTIANRAEAQPNNAPSSPNCLAGGYFGGWSDQKCDSKEPKHFVCSYDHWYQYKENHYALFREKRNYRDAVYVCYVYGASLARSTAANQDFLNSLAGDEKFFTLGSDDPAGEQIFICQK